MKNTPISTFIPILFSTKIVLNWWKTFIEKFIICPTRTANPIIRMSLILRIHLKIAQGKKRKNWDRKSNNFNKNFQNFNPSTQWSVNKTSNCKPRSPWQKPQMLSPRNMFTEFWCSLTRFNTSSLQKKYRTNWSNSQVYWQIFIKDKKAKMQFLPDALIPVRNGHLTLKQNSMQQIITQRRQVDQTMVILPGKWRISLNVQAINSSESLIKEDSL